VTDLSLHSVKKTNLGLHLLGAPRLECDGFEVKLVLKKVLGLLAYLALEGRSPRSLLVSLFWSNLDEESARRNLRRELHRLKTKVVKLEGRVQALEDDLELQSPFSTDVQAFLEALERDDLEAALGLYTRPLLENFELDGADGFQEWLMQQREYLERRRQKAILDLAERFETRGDWRRALELHLQLLEHDQLQERHHREAMRLHYLLGERTAALERFELCKTVLGRELGLNPLPETLSLVNQIRATQTLELVARQVETQTWQLEAPLLGRATWLEQLSTLRGAVLVVGEAGVGKTRLVSESTQDQNALWVRFAQTSGRSPLAAVAQAIRNALEQPEAQQQLGNLERVWRLELARLLPELEPNVALEPVSGQEARQLFLEGVSRALLSLSDCLVLDDLHWADETSLELIRKLIPKLEYQKMILIARPVELASNQAATELSKQLEWAQHLPRLELPPLDADAVQKLVWLNLPEAPPDFSQRLNHTTQGNPFFVLESLRYVLERPEARDLLPVPPTVREAVLERVNRLGEPARRLLEVASLTDDGFSLPELIPATALTDLEGVEALERAVNAQFLTRLEHGYAFAHDLARQAILGNVSVERCSLIHGKLADAFEALEVAPARVAHHLEMAHRRKQAVPWRVKAAQAAANIYANHESLEQYAKALEDGATGLVVGEIHLERGQLWNRLDNAEQWKTEIEVARGIAAKLQEQAFAKRVSLEQLDYQVRSHAFSEAVQLGESILVSSDLNLEDQADVLKLLGMAFRGLGQFGQAADCFQKVIQLQLPFPSLRTGHAHIECGQLDYTKGHIETADQHQKNASSHYEALNEQNAMISALNLGAAIAIAQGNLDEGVRFFEQALEKARALQIVSAQRIMLRNLAQTDLETGAFHRAIERLEEALQFAVQAVDTNAQASLLSLLARAHSARGNLGEALSCHEHSRSMIDQTGTMQNKITSRLKLVEFLLLLNALQAAQEKLEETEQLIAEHALTHFKPDVLACQLSLSLNEHNIGRAERQLLELKGLSLEDVENQARSACIEAKVHLVRQDYLAALGLIPTIEKIGLETLNAEAYCIELEAKAYLGQVKQAQIKRGLALLQTDKLTLALRLAVCHALIIAFNTTNDLAGANQVRLEVKTYLLEATESLEPYPAFKHSFLKKYHDLLEI
jgi:DNA-binding SARP family transcriptional activator